MSRFAFPALGVVLCGAVLTLRAAVPGGPGGPPPVTPQPVTPQPVASHAAFAGGLSVQAQNDMVQEFCVTCHDNGTKTAGLTLETFDAAHIGERPEIGEKMVRKLRTGLMPPKGEPQPAQAQRMALAASIEASLDAAAAAHPNPGHRSFQRLNRAEYGAAVRALFGLDLDVGAYLPADTISNSFDNIADVQTPSATVMQGYLRAAAYVSRAAVGDPKADSSSTIYDVPRTESQKDRIEGAPFGTRGGAVVTHNFLADGKYKFQMLLHGEPTGALFGRTIGNIQMEVAIDGARVALVKVDRWITESDPAGLQVSTEPVTVTAGPHVVAATFLREFEGQEDDLMKPIEHTLADTQIGIGYGVTTLPHLRNLAIVGPFDVTGVSDNPAREKVFVCHPAKPSENDACAQRIVERLATEAYRRPATAADLAELMPFYRQGLAAGGFDAGIRNVVQATLSSLHFLFRVEETPADVRPGAVYRISDVDLASRLSFFLWGTIPDRELIDVAARGGLSTPAVFTREVQRMLADPRAEALSTRFAAQWLRLQDLRKIEPDAIAFPYYDETLAEAMTRETELLFDHVLRTDRPALELLTADYTFVNERLARHYGIEGVSGPEFRQVSYPDDHRRGLLGQGSILTLTSHGDRTSPVLRGKWVLEVLLGSPPPPPPPNVPDLDKTNQAHDGRLLSVAEQMAQHRASPFCSSCHNVIDPIGLALDHFDVTGAWRIKDRGVAVNSAGELFDGTKINGATELRTALLARSDVVLSHLTELLLSYAVGRRTEYYDMPTVRRIVHDAAAKGGTLSALVLGVTESPAFRTARADAVNDVRK